LLSLSWLRVRFDPAKTTRLLDQSSPIVLASLITLVFYHGFQLIQESNGGSDLVGADIPKSLMLLNGQNPYSTQPWASPYPPLLLLTVSGIIRFTNLITGQTTVDLISQNLRTVGLVADTIVALTIYLFIRHQTRSSFQALIPAALFLTIPALSTSPLYFFHSDTFGYPILAISLAALATRRYLLGTSLLAIATIYKIHPILAIPLVLVWLTRTRGIRATLPSLATTTIIIGLGLILPFTLPGYQTAVLGFNLSNAGNGTTLQAALRSLNDILPSQLQITPSQFAANQIWITATLALFTVVLGTVWTKAKTLNPIDIVLLGLLAWLIPLRIEYTHYVAWAVIPVLMRGRIQHSILVLGLLQFADTIAYWTWWPNTSLIPNIDPVTGPILTSIMYRILGLTALGLVLFTIRNKTSLARSSHWSLPSLSARPQSSQSLQSRQSSQSRQ
jgi:hypothetical protein